MKGLLAILMSIHLLTVKDDIYVIFDAMADTIFYFLPVLIAFTTAKKFKVNQMTAVIIALCLVYPSLTEIFAKGESLSFFHLTIPSVNYPTNIIPVILAIGLLHFVEKGLEQCIPEIVKGFFNSYIFHCHCNTCDIVFIWTYWFLDRRYFSQRI